MTPRDLVQSPGWKVMPWIERYDVGGRRSRFWVTGDMSPVQNSTC